jgi:hypothetical protein
MSSIWDMMQSCAETLCEKMSTHGTRDLDPILEKYSWENHIYKSNKFRRGHVEIVDQRDQHGLFILHATVFPCITSNAPIWGFDAVCGKNKITGAFHDFSLPASYNHPMFKWWEEKSSGYSWNKPRTLPEWAQAIFSKNMVAAGNVQNLHEVAQFINLGIESLDYYLNNCQLYLTDGYNNTELQNTYCRYQKQNPHVIRSMVAMGYKYEVIESFIHEILFPEILN